MAMLTVRNLRPDVHQKLREQAAAHGRSMEAEARALIEEGVKRDAEDMLTALRRFADEVAPTEEEMAIIFPPRKSDHQRPIIFGDEPA